MNRANGVDVGRLDHLDMMRAVSAFLVLAGLLRSDMFQSYGELAPQSSGIFFWNISRFAYFSTGLGHQAVILFFALSGFLVGGKAMDDLRSGERWLSHPCRRSLSF